jgi:uncharacterized protein (TIGR03085 family)
MPQDAGVTSYARAERAALCDLFVEVGPDAPTLCEGWTARDLAAHLVVRERRPDASVGIVVRPLAGWTEKVQDGEARRPFPELVDKVRTGPPLYSFFRLPGVDELANTFEYVVHHEDVRRAVPGWEPRDLDPAFRGNLWARLRKSGRMLFGSSGVGVVLRRTDAEGGPVEAVLRAGSPAVTVSGDVVELVMHAFGRSEAHVLIEGDDEVVDAYGRASRGI